MCGFPCSSVVTLEFEARMKYWLFVVHWIWFYCEGESESWRNNSVPSHKIYLKQADMGILIKQNFRYRPWSFWRNICYEFGVESEINFWWVHSTWARNTDSEKSPLFCWGSGMKTHSGASIPLILNNICLYFTAKNSKI